MIRAALRHVALRLPPIRRLVDQLRVTEAARQTAETARVLAESERQTAEAGRATVEASRNAALAALAEAQGRLAQAEAAAAAAQEQAARSVVDTLRSVVAASASANWLRVRLNGSLLWLPRDTLQIMAHCGQREPDGTLALWVETAHLTWMMQRLESGGTFLDVGCATGATTLPMAATLGERVRIIAYEPASAARSLLAATLERNAIDGVTLRPAAVSDRAGTAAFREFLPDETGQTPWMPEASTLIGARIADSPHHMTEVPVVTLDEDALPHCAPGPLVVKIDVEGFEAFALRGAARLIAERRPWFSIDIHHDPFGEGEAMTDPAVRAILAPSGYAFERIGHVLLCTPAAA